MGCVLFDLDSGLVEPRIMWDKLLEYDFYYNHRFKGTTKVSTHLNEKT